MKTGVFLPLCTMKYFAMVLNNYSPKWRWIIVLPNQGNEFYRQNSAGRWLLVHARTLVTEITGISIVLLHFSDINRKMSHNHFGHIIIARANCRPFFERKCINLIKPKFWKNYPIIFVNVCVCVCVCVRARAQNIDLTYTKKFRVSYRPNFPIIQLYVFQPFHSWYKWQYLSNHAYVQQWRTNAKMRKTLFTGFWYIQLSDIA